MDSKFTSVVQADIMLGAEETVEEVQEEEEEEVVAKVMVEVGKELVAVGKKEEKVEKEQEGEEEEKEEGEEGEEQEEKEKEKEEEEEEEEEGEGGMVEEEPEKQKEQENGQTGGDRQEQWNMPAEDPRKRLSFITSVDDERDGEEAKKERDETAEYRTSFM